MLPVCPSICECPRTVGVPRENSESVTVRWGGAEEMDSDRVREKRANK